MNIKNFLKWLFVVLWPFLLVSFFTLVYIFGLRIFSIDVQKFKNIFGAVLQIFGGAIVIFHLYRSIRTYKKNPFSNYLLILRSCPINRNIKELVNIILKMPSINFHIDLTLIERSLTQKEKIAKLQNQLDELRQSMESSQEESNRKLDTIKQEIYSIKDNSDKRYDELKNDAVVTLLDIFPIQLLGFIFIVVGLLLPVV